MKPHRLAALTGINLLALVGVAAGCVLLNGNPTVDLPLRAALLSLLLPIGWGVLGWDLPPGTAGVLVLANSVAWAGALEWIACRFLDGRDPSRD